jgi:hypothetical protein
MADSLRGFMTDQEIYQEGVSMKQKEIIKIKKLLGGL